MSDYELKRFDELEPGDMIPGSQGPVEVTKVYDVHLPEAMWELTADDGSTIKVSGNHLWYCETKLDWELHGGRKKDGKRLLKHLTPETLTLLEETAMKEGAVETRLIDMVTLVQGSRSQELVNLVERIADSLGHVSENTLTFEDLGLEGTEEETIRTYDARLFAQQLLKLTGLKQYKRYSLVVGSVMTTDAMLELMDTVEIPTTRCL